MNDIAEESNPSASPALGGSQRPLRIAIIGAGPAGFFAAQALFVRAEEFQVDMIEKLPTPYGLVRGGVAPDHQKIKSVANVFDKIAAHPNFRFFGNLELGKHVSVAELREHYDYLIYAVGCQADKSLGIPGEDLAGSHSATALVGWYNGHPEFRDLKFDFSVEKVAVVGIGNVATDVVRILAQDPANLASTDIADYALEALKKSRIREIHFLGRRGPAQASFTPVELEELASLQSAELVVSPQELEAGSLSTDPDGDDRVEANLHILRERAKRTSSGDQGKKILLRFMRSPVALLGTEGRVTALQTEGSELFRDHQGAIRCRGNGKLELFPAGMVVRAVGYQGTPISGTEFDSRAGRVSNIGGRVVKSYTNRVVDGDYVVGWAKRGPSGLIGANRSDAFDTVHTMLEDIASKPCVPTKKKTARETLELFRSRSPGLVTFLDWKVLNRLEVEQGQKAGKVREKFTDVQQMLAAIHNASKDELR